MTTSESKGRFFTKQIESIRIANRIDSNRELECSSTRYYFNVCSKADMSQLYVPHGNDN